MELLRLINELNQQKTQKYPATTVRKVCECIAGTAFNDRTFGRWRIVADVVEHRRDLMWGECLVLGAIAYLKHGNLRRPVTPNEIIEVLKSDPIRQMLGECITEEIELGVIGQKTCDRIRKCAGRNWSRASLYRKIPGFSLKQKYYAGDIDRFLFFLGHRETETIA